MEGALHESGHEAAAVRRITMQVVRRVDFVRRGRCGPTDQIVIDGVTVQQRLHLGQPVRPMACADHPNMGVVDSARLILIVKKENAGKGEIALTPGEFTESPAPSLQPIRQMQLGDDLVRLAHRRQGAREEFAGGDRTCSGGTGEGNLSIARYRDARQFGRRIRMRETAADSAAIAHLIVRDVSNRFSQQGMRLCEPPITLDVAPSHESAEPNAVVVDGDVIQPL